MGYSTMIIGFREDDVRRYMMTENGSVTHTVLAGRCGSCRGNTYLNPSGVDALRHRDCAVYCYFCAIEQKEYDAMIADLS